MPIAFLAAAVLILPLVALLLWRWPVAFAGASVVAAAFADLIGIGKKGFEMGVTVYPTDLACAALVVSCVVVAARFRSVPRDLCWPALILLFLGVLNFARGVVVFGIQAPGNGARDLVNLVLPAVAFTAFGPAIRMTVDRLTGCLSWVSIALAALALARWAGVMPMPATDFTDDFRSIERVLPSDAAMIIGQALIAVLGLQMMRGFRTTLLLFAGALASLVFALQHRSVWIATMAGLLWLIVRSPRLPRPEWLKLSSIVLLLGAALTLAPLLSPGMVERVSRLVGSNVEEIRRDDSTWAWRVEGYIEAVQRALSESITEAVVGPPSGRDLSDKAGFASIHIHDRYISALAYYGLTGLVMVLVWLFSSAARIRRQEWMPTQDGSRGTAKVALQALLIAAIVYFVPYSGGQMEGSLLGIMWLACARRPAEKDAFPPRSTTTIRMFGAHDLAEEWRVTVGSSPAATG
ncbi:MAG: hypothetical protein JWN34_674 [Bryobacterales bacterium]|nr:hypothetical protein [Bryobacterales bacterium]